MPARLQTTIAGSLPKPQWLAEPVALWAPWKLDGDALAQGKRDAVRLALFDQISRPRQPLGLGVELRVRHRPEVADARGDQCLQLVWSHRSSSLKETEDDVRGGR